MKKLKASLALNITNIPGWRTKRKIVVIESDDWGTIRMSSAGAYERLLEKGYPVNRNEYNRYDAIESNEDLGLLFETLNSVKDSQNNPAVLTANNIVANPDFEKIAAAGFNKFYYVPFTQTLQEYPSHHRVMELYRQGIHEKLVMPQLHGREHINVPNWLHALQNGIPAAIDAFGEKMFSVANGKGHSCRKEFLDGFGTFSTAAINALEQVIIEASDLFETIWGFRSASIIAPCYTWHPAVEPFFLKAGIKYIQGGRVQKVPLLNTKEVKHTRHFTGQRNALRQVYLVRNVFFEPFSDLGKDWVDAALKEIQNAFLWGKPAIISSHRVNYTGFLDPQHRQRNLALLQQLLKRIVQKWPSVEFMATNQLGDLLTTAA